MGKKKTSRKQAERAEKARGKAIAKAQAKKAAQAKADEVRAWGQRAAAAVEANKHAEQQQHAASLNEADVASEHAKLTRGSGASPGAPTRSKSPAPTARLSQRYPSRASLGVDEARQDRLALLVAVLCIVCAFAWGHVNGQLRPVVIVDENSGLRIFDTPPPRLWYGADLPDIVDDPEPPPAFEQEAVIKAEEEEPAHGEWVKDPETGEWKSYRVEL